MENWATDPEVLGIYARHFETGQPMPRELIEKIHKTRHFNQGFATTEYLAASLLDMDWHTLAEAKPTLDVLKFENDCLSRIGLIPEIAPRYRSAYFQHIFAGGYAAGYYSYIWAEVLDADAFQAFKETGNVFDGAPPARFASTSWPVEKPKIPWHSTNAFAGRRPASNRCWSGEGSKSDARARSPG